jgi:hypothetical protein
VNQTIADRYSRHRLAPLHSVTVGAVASNCKPAASPGQGKTGSTFLEAATFRAMSRMICLCLLACALLGCERKRQNSGGLPPASSWSEGGSGAAVAPGTPGAPQGTRPNNPHAGVDMNNPHAGVDMNDPHAGVDMSGQGGGVDVTKMGLEGPNPERKLDPNRYVRGVIKAAPDLKGKVKAGTAVFVLAKKADASGAPLPGPPLAVVRLEWKDNLPFELTEANQMIEGTQFTGDVVIQVRYDQDSDALSKQPGDLTGLQKVTIPAKDVTVTLDTILP